MAPCSLCQSKTSPPSSLKSPLPQTLLHYRLFLANIAKLSSITRSFILQWSRGFISPLGCCLALTRQEWFLFRQHCNSQWGSYHDPYWGVLVRDDCTLTPQSVTTPSSNHNISHTQLVYHSFPAHSYLSYRAIDVIILYQGIKLTCVIGSTSPFKESLGIEITPGPGI